MNNLYSLYDINNFKKNAIYTEKEVIERYNLLVNEYYKYILENISISIKNIHYFKFIFTRGLETITHVFSIILYYTNNLDMTYYHGQKSFYFYVEFVEQISEDENKFLKLNSRDATLYVYKKTIYEINNEYKKNYTSDLNTTTKLDFFNQYIKIVKILIMYIIEDDSFVKNKEITNTSILKYEKICGLLIELIDLPLKVEDLKDIYSFIYHLNLMEIELEKYIEIIELFLKKINKNKLFLKKIDKDYNTLQQIHSHSAKEFIKLITL